MGSLFLSELGLDCRLSSKPGFQRPIGQFLSDVSKIHCDSEKILKLEDYVNRLQDEMMKIDGLKRELPLCMELLRDAISAAKEELARCSLKPVPVLAEFIPLKKTCTDEKDDKAEDSKSKGEDNSSKDKMNWMSSVQLWNSDNNSNFPSADISDKPSLEVENKKKVKEEELNRPVMDNLFKSGKNKEVERAFGPFKECNFPLMPVKEYMDESPVSGLSLCTPGIKNSREETKHIGFSLKSSFSRPSLSSATIIQSNFKVGPQQPGRKQRRCWSEELHRQFIEALNHLGGPLVATPKQIREHMQVNGLTNDEVKSHLQKYRAHMKRGKSNSSSQTAAFWSAREEVDDFLKQRNSKSNSPDGPLQLSECNGVDDEDEDEAKSESSSADIRK